MLRIGVVSALEEGRDPAVIGELGVRRGEGGGDLDGLRHPASIAALLVEVGHLEIRADLLRPCLHHSTVLLFRPFRLLPPLPQLRPRQMTLHGIDGAQHLRLPPRSIAAPADDPRGLAVELDQVALRPDVSGIQPDRGLELGADLSGEGEAGEPARSLGQLAQGATQPMMIFRAIGIPLDGTPSALRRRLVLAELELAAGQPVVEGGVAGVFVSGALQECRRPGVFASPECALRLRAGVLVVQRGAYRGKGQQGGEQPGLTQGEHAGTSSSRAPALAIYYRQRGNGVRGLVESSRSRWRWIAIVTLVIGGSVAV